MADEPIDPAAQALANANLTAIRNSNRSAHAQEILDPIILVFDMSDPKVRDLATHCFRGETPAGAVAVWAKPLQLTFNWITRTYGDDALAGRLKAPEHPGAIQALVFTAAGCTQLELV
ncbi:MAG TPA: hypothetical protein VG056_07570 [Pirellulales bacterium]|jgi:hypothetical protein|nr:hypothetical protein [Pirellulales bacterium]